MQYRLNEQETAINYDNQTEKWHIYSTFGPHARKWEKALEPGARKEYTKNGTLIMIDGDLRDDYYLMVTKRRKLTDEQRQMAAKRLAKANAKKKEHKNSVDELLIRFGRK
ncbi:hypothetical protein ACLOBP_05090 [Limosilactobacillus fermentum]|uniref:hypothetical protein n=1 Tax=Limosilactobacillus fermentum TaxID=1613 RepID=UPI003EB98B47